MNDHLKEVILNSINCVSDIKKYNTAMAFTPFRAIRKDILGKVPLCIKTEGEIVNSFIYVVLFNVHLEKPTVIAGEDC